jgi:hypothetical protein
MAENIVAGLFGMNPEMYGEQQRRSALQEGITLAQLDPASRGAAMTYAGARGLGNAIGGAFGIEDPQLKMISARNTIAQQIDQTDPESILKGAQMLAQMGDQQGAMALAQYARQAQSEMAQTQQRRAAALASTAQATRERQQAIPNDIQIANEIATLETSLLDIENTPDSPDRTRAKNLLNSRLSALKSLAFKGEKAVAANIKEVGVAEGTREPVYLDVNNDQQFVYKKDETGKQVRVPFTGGVDRTTAKTSLGVKLPEGESEFVKALGKKDAERVDAAITLRDTAVSTINSLNKLASLPDNQLITGQFATGRVGATNLLVTLGLAAPSDTNRLVSSQEYQKVAGDVILQTLGGKLGSGFSNADREFIQGLIPQLETNPAARRQLISFMQNKNQEIVKESIRLENYAREKKGLSGFEPKIPMSVAPSQPRPYSGLTNEQLEAKIRAAQAQQPR